MRLPQPLQFPRPVVNVLAQPFLVFGLEQIRIAQSRWRACRRSFAAVRAASTDHTRFHPMRLAQSQLPRGLVDWNARVAAQNLPLAALVALRLLGQLAKCVLRLEPLDPAQ